MKKYRLYILLIIPLVSLYFLGPTPKPVIYPSEIPFVPENFLELEKFVSYTENTAGAIKPKNEAKIVWAGSKRHKTEFAIVYLHGFAASHYESYPVHLNFALATGCNLYLSRLADHGRMSKAPLLHMTPDSLYKTALTALAIGKKLGKKVILMGCSTGASLALKLAADFPNDVHSLILYSPNIRLRNNLAPILTMPWGLQIAKAINNGDTYTTQRPFNEKAFWYSWYRIEGVLYLQQFIDDNMNVSLFEKVKQPIFCGYYYKNRIEQDNRVDISKIRWMFNNVGTPDSLKHLVNFPEAGTHTIACSFRTDRYQEVLDSTLSFYYSTIVK